MRTLDALKETSVNKPLTSFSSRPGRAEVAVEGVTDAMASPGR